MATNPPIDVAALQQAMMAQMPPQGQPPAPSLNPDQGQPGAAPPVPIDQQAQMAQMQQQTPQAPPQPPPALQQQPAQAPGMAAPNVIRMIAGMINPQSRMAGMGTGAGRAEVFENFLGNFVTALGAGFSAAHGPGAFGKGLGAGIQAPYQQGVQQFQLQQQAQANQAQIQGEQARTGLTQEQTRYYPQEQQARLDQMTMAPRYDPKTGQILGTMTNAQWANYVTKMGIAQEATKGKIGAAEVTQGIDPATGKSLSGRTMGDFGATGDLANLPPTRQNIALWNAQQRASGKTSTRQMIINTPDGQQVMSLTSSTRPNLPMGKGAGMPTAPQPSGVGNNMPRPGSRNAAPDGPVAKPIYNAQGQPISSLQSVNFVDKTYVQPANAIEKSWKMMDSVYQEYKAAQAQGKTLDTGAQSMVALSQHISNTFGGVKGARVTKDMIWEHLGARSISDDALVAFQRLTNGDVLSPNQWEAFHSLIKTSRDISWQQAANTASRRHVDISDSIPGDVSLQVQIPGQQPGPIDARNLPAFMKKYPSARVVQ